jgi:hypothetical protein
MRQFNKSFKTAMVSYEKCIALCKTSSDRPQAIIRSNIVWRLQGGIGLVHMALKNPVAGRTALMKTMADLKSLARRHPQYQANYEHEDLVAQLFKEKAKKD